MLSNLKVRALLLIFAVGYQWGMKTRQQFVIERTVLVICALSQISSYLQIIVIAVLMRSVMRRSFSVFQWEALFLLVAGITVNQLSSCDGSKYADIMSPVALLYTLGSITIPSLASVYNEFGFKKNMETSVLLQNFFLYFYGACFNMFGAFFMSVFVPGSTVSGLFTGFRAVTFAIVINNAFQGILSSFFFKFADTILKKYSSTIATIFTGLMSAALFGHPITMNFLIGVSIVFISMHLFFSLGTFPGHLYGYWYKCIATSGAAFSLLLFECLQEGQRDRLGSQRAKSKHPHPCAYPRRWII